MNCTKCGTPLQPEDRFCYYCGTPIEQPAPATPSTAQLTPVTPPAEQPTPITPLAEQSIPVTPPVEQPTPITPPAEQSSPMTPPAEQSIPVTPPVEQPIPVTPSVEQSTPVTPPMPEQPVNPLFGSPVPPKSSFQPMGTQSVGAVSHDRKLSGRTFLGILSIVVGCLIIIGIVMSLFVGGSYKSALKEMWYKVERQDTDGAVACMFPEEAEGQISAAAARMEPYIQDLHTRAEARYGEKYQIDVKFDDIDKLDTSELKQFNIWFENLSLEDAVKKVYAVEYTLSIKGSKGRESEDYECYIYRYDGNWYVLDTDLLGLQDPL